MTIWRNYHFTHSVDVADDRRFNRDGTMQPAGTTSGPEMLTASAALLGLHISDADALGSRCGLVGKAWSFSRLTGNAALQLHCGGKLAWENDLEPDSGLVGLVAVRVAELHPSATVPADTLAWVRGGTTMRELAVWAENHELTLSTSGDQLGPSLAGAIATGTHGSKLGFGAVQNMVRGLHVITSSGTSVWLEPASRPMLDDAAASQFADEIVRDDGRFADTVVHLGAMGIINGAIVELDRKQRFDKYVATPKLESIQQEWIAAIEARDFAEVSHLLGFEGEPVFYEFSLNPFDPFGAESVHILYYKSHSLVTNIGPVRTPRPADAISYYFSTLAAGGSQVRLLSNLDLPALYVFLVQQDWAANGKHSGLTWSDLHSKDEETGERGALFNAGFALPFDQLQHAITVMCDAVATFKNDRQFIFTYRFVTKAAGRLAHLRWDESIAIELDGASRLFADKYQVTPISEIGLQLVQRAFDKVGLEYCMHWGKLGNSAQLVARNFGSRAIAGSPIAQWSASRSALLQTDQGKRTMQNDLVVLYGLV